MKFKCAKCSFSVGTRIAIKFCPNCGSPPLGERFYEASLYQKKGVVQYLHVGADLARDLYEKYGQALTYDIKARFDYNRAVVEIIPHKPPKVEEMHPKPAVEIVKPTGIPEQMQKDRREQIVASRDK